MPDSTPIAAATAPPPPARNLALADIERLAATLATHRQNLRESHAILEKQIAALVDKHKSSIDPHVLAVTEADEILRQAIAASPGLFEKRRTRIVHGLKIGLEKGRVGVLIADDARTLTLIKRRFRPDQATHYIHVQERPNREALTKLPAKELAALGVTLADTSDRVIVRDAETDTERLVKMLTAPAKPAKAGTGQED